jgi:hypothetical protein
MPALRSLYPERPKPNFDRSEDKRKKAVLFFKKEGLASACLASARLPGH